MKRSIVIFLGAAGLASIAYFHWSRTLAGGSLEERREYTEYSARTERESQWAPVQLWWEAPPDVRGEWRARKSARITPIRGEAFVGDSHIPREKIRELLDARVS